jgi:hypothetical protein
MADETGNDTQAMSEFLREEIARTIASFRRTLVIGALLVLVVLASLSKLTLTLQELTRPESVADLVTGISMTAVPRAGMAAESALLDAAPTLADALVDQIREAIPAVRTDIQGRLHELTQAMTQGAAAEMAVALGEELDRAKGASLQARMGAAADALVARLDKAVDAETRPGSATQDLPVGTDFFRGFDAAAGELQSIKLGIERLAAGKGLTSQEKLERRLIETWLKFVR